MAKKKKSKRYAPKTREMYEKLVEAFRDHPGNFSAAARAAGFHRKTAKNCWENGWRGIDWAIPISEIIAKEQDIARAQIFTEEPLPSIDEHLRVKREEQEFEEKNERRRALEQAAEVRVQEAKLIAGMRGVLGRNMAAIGSMQPGIVKLAEAVNRRLLQKVETGKIDEDKAASLIRKVAGAMRDTASSLQMVLESERLHMGEPTAILGLQDQFDSMPLEDAAAEVERAHRAVQRAKRRGFIPSETGDSPAETAEDTVH